MPGVTKSAESWATTYAYMCPKLVGKSAKPTDEFTAWQPTWHQAGSPDRSARGTFLAELPSNLVSKGARTRGGGGGFGCGGRVFRTHFS